MSSNEAWTIGRLLQWTADYLKQRGADNPRLDAEVLLAHAAGCERIELYTRFNDAADEPLRETFRQLVRRRADGTPVAYLVGRREFYSLAFQVTPAVLIPRPETEFVVIEVLDLLKRPEFRDRPVEVADVGTGSGVIAVCVARHAPRCHVTALDISPEALAVASENARRHQVAERVTCVQSDLLEALPDHSHLDIVVSNPPYVTQSEYDALPAMIRDHEPRQALLGGADGLDVIARLVPQAADHLVAGGALVLEISPMLAERVCDLLRADPRWSAPTLVRDLAGLSRVVRVLKQS
ncbi:MAG: peptide chain release factor N(5)-glutamine methyltransferase [Pirellulaceae bacterium]|nr:peptide chain release factor N(5)-glutamine methyltransferase [Pirellulaceae bacterium]